MDSSHQADAALSRVFLTPQDDFAGLVPDYWKPCVLAGLIGKSAKCHFSSELLAIPGVAIPVESPSVSKPAIEAPPSASNSPVFRKGSGVSPPRPVFTPEPKFTEVARKAKLSGVVTLGLVVDNAGRPVHVHILDPMGCGLDAEAVHIMETWRFEPAKKDGEPVAVEIEVEMDFHRY
jgi:TonB family protein